MTVPYDEEFELYHYGESICSQMARLALCEKDVAYKSHHLHLELNGEHLSKEFRSINPTALVPVLVHNGNPIYDSWRIIKYLDECFPNQGESLWPKDVEKVKLVERLMVDSALDENEPIGENFGSSIAGASSYILANILRRRSIPSIIKDYFFKHPLKNRGVAFLIMRLTGSLPKPFYKKFVKRLARGLTSIENQLNHGGDYIIGEYSAVDIMLTAHFHRLEDIAFGSLLESDEFPNIREYWKKIKARPSYQKAMLDHHSWEWRDAIKAVYGDEDNPFMGFLKKELKTVS
ncbi:maleylacetoacetate isomerase [Maricurvus nonylphenolicus]|uniref:glutathione S-transferase family protein n=1 Tax=Maricurvus nonylphenolicus TaxID=1008307 RepID=UPI0036F1C665